MSSALLFVTLSGVPIDVSELKWPFHPSGSGADWFVLHGRADLLQSEDKLHVEVAVGMTQTMKESLGALDSEHAEGLVVNAVRKTVDNGQLAFVKSGKLQPVHVTSRFYNFRTGEIQFPAQDERDIREMIKRRVFWLGQTGHGPVEIAHPYDCQYVNLSRENMIALAKQIAALDLIKLDGDKAIATPALLNEEAAMRAAMQKGIEAGLAANKVSA
jgi:hypothetical protein